MVKFLAMSIRVMATRANRLLKMSDKASPEKTSVQLASPFASRKDNAATLMRPLVMYSYLSPAVLVALKSDLYDTGR